MGDVPFRDVYIHALVRDAEGREDEQIQGQCHRSAYNDWIIRHGQLSLDPYGDGSAGPE